MNTIQLLNVEDIVANRDKTLDETLNILPGASKSVYFDDKNVAVYPYDPGLKKIIKDDMYKQIPSASGHKQVLDKNNAISSDNEDYIVGEGFTRLDKKKFMSTAIYAGLGVLVFRGLFK